MYFLAKLKINSLFYDDVMTKFTCNILNFFYLHFCFYISACLSEFSILKLWLEVFITLNT